MPADRLEQFLSWARYLHWSEILYARWMTTHQERGDADSEVSDALWFALAAQWLASVWVVVEGWQSLKMSDRVIDKLLDAYPDYCDLLKRFRNGVYHFQREVFDERLRAFPTNGQETLFWVMALFYEFKRFYWEWPDKHSGTVQENEDLRAAVHRTVGWLPNDILHARAHQIQNLQREAERSLAEAGDYSSKEAVELLAAIAQVKDDISRVEKSPLLDVLTRINPRH